jgi:mannose-6-phosphate isomerase-like protein (cupin superfamily)
VTGWRAGQLEQLPSTAEPGFWEQWAREPEYGARWHSVGEHFGIRGFGVNANEADTGGELIVPHTEMAYGEQEELYVLLRGRARFTCDGEAVELEPGGLLWVEPQVAREAVALEDGTMVVCVGGTPGRPFTPG